MLRSIVLVNTLFFAAACYCGEPDAKTKHQDPESEAVQTEDGLADNSVVILSTEPVASEELICKRERVTGTHITKKICRTRAQVEAERAAAEDFMRRTRLAPSATPSEGN